MKLANVNLNEKPSDFEAAISYSMGSLVLTFTKLLKGSVYKIFTASVCLSSLFWK